MKLPRLILASLLPLAACGGSVRPLPNETEVLASGLHQPGHLAVEASGLVFSVGGSDAYCLTECPHPDGALDRVDFDDGSLSVIFEPGEAFGAVAVDSERAYALLRSGRVVSVPKEGGSPEDIASGRQQPNLLALGTDSVYWTDCGSCGPYFEPDARLLKRAKSGGAALEIAAPGDFASGLAVDGDQIYLSHRDRDAGTSLIDAFASDGAPMANLVSAEGPFGTVAVDATHVYYATLDDVLRVPRTGGTPERIVSGMTPRSLAVDDQYLYFTNPSPAVATGSVLRVAKTGGTPETIASDQHQPSAIAVDATHVYWTNAGTFGERDGTVMAFGK